MKIAASKMFVGLTLLLQVTFCLAQSNTIGKELAEPITSDPVSSLEKIVVEFEKFFSKPQKLLVKYSSKHSPTGNYAYVLKYVGTNIKYDVQKTNSLVTPFTGEIKLKMESLANSKCGTLPYLSTVIGWPLEAAAIAASNQESCYKGYGLEEPENVTFGYSYQKNKWVLKQITRSYVSTTEIYPARQFLATVGMPSDTSVVPTDPESQEFNHGWRQTIMP
jgi:hypothetical protein